MTGSIICSTTPFANHNRHREILRPPQKEHGQVAHRRKRQSLKLHRNVRLPHIVQFRIAISTSRTGCIARSAVGYPQSAHTQRRKEGRSDCEGLLLSSFHATTPSGVAPNTEPSEFTMS